VLGEPGRLDGRVRAAARPIAADLRGPQRRYELGRLGAQLLEVCRMVPICLSSAEYEPAGRVRRS